jgi:hypothetical protein
MVLYLLFIELGESITLKMNQIRFSDAVVFTHLISKQKASNFIDCYNFDAKNCLFIGLTEWFAAKLSQWLFLKSD